MNPAHMQCQTCSVLIHMPPLVVIWTNCQTLRGHRDHPGHGSQQTPGLPGVLCDIPLASCAAGAKGEGDGGAQCCPSRAWSRPVCSRCRRSSTTACSAHSLLAVCGCQWNVLGMLRAAALPLPVHGQSPHHPACSPQYPLPASLATAALRQPWLHNAAPACSPMGFSSGTNAPTEL